ncbi:MAG TPA: hypothetical protein VF176_04975 [Solirubrobacterales bacterium]
MNLIPGGDSSATLHHRIDLAIGIALGLVLGIAVVAAFVFLGSEDTIDAPRISGVDTGKSAPPAKRMPAQKPEAPPAEEHQ